MEESLLIKTALCICSKTFHLLLLTGATVVVRAHATLCFACLMKISAEYEGEMSILHSLDFVGH